MRGYQDKKATVADVFLNRVVIHFRRALGLTSKFSIITVLIYHSISLIQKILSAVNLKKCSRGLNQSTMYHIMDYFTLYKVIEAV